MSSVPALEYPFADAPAPAQLRAVAPGVHWLRMTLPFALDHINLWLLEDGDGWALVDSGLGNGATRAVWEQVFSSGVLGGRPLRRVIVTHYHPDHAGNAAWLCDRFGATLWMTRGEFLTVHAVYNGVASYSPGANAALFAANGLDDEGVAALSRRGDLYRALVPEFPTAHRRLVDGGQFEIGGRAWRVIVGYGHSPEHAALWCESLDVLISGDMLLPRISTNVAVRPIDPESDPLGLFLESIARFRAVGAGALVLPSHGLPFRGAHARIEALEAHHAERLDALAAFCAEAPRTAAEALPVLFRRKIDASQVFFAMGEAIAHLHRLQYTGRAARSVGTDGVARFAGMREDARGVHRAA